MKTRPRQHISNKYNTYGTVVTSPVYIGSKSILKVKQEMDADKN